MKKFYVSKTFIFNALTIVVAIATYFGFSPNQDLATQTTTILIGVSPFINLLLRFITKEKLTW